MQPDQVTVLFTGTAETITSHVYGPSAPIPSAYRGNSGALYPDIREPLEQRGLPCSVDFGADDYVLIAELPDGSHLTISPAPERSGDSPPAWLATRTNPDADLFEVVYNSEPGGAQAANGGSRVALVAGIDACLDQLGVPTRHEMDAVLARAESLLHRAGFISVTRFRDSYHRLPAAMTDKGERRATVTRAVDYLRAEGYAFACPAELLDSGLPPARLQTASLAQVSVAISQAGHTSEVTGALSELTAPGDGVLDQVVGVLNQTADWWEGLGGAADPHYAGRLRHIAQMAEVYAREIRAMHGDLADRHSAHPDFSRPARPTAAAVVGADARIAAALATSPSVDRTLAGHPAEAGLAAAVAAVRPAGPRR